MGTLFWIRRFLIVYLIGFAVIAASHLLRGRPMDQALTEAAMWGALAAAIFVAEAIYRFRKAAACALCADEPDYSQKV